MEKKQCPYEIDCSSCSSLIDTAERSECVQGYDRKPEPNWEAKHTRLVEKCSPDSIDKYLQHIVIGTPSPIEGLSIDVHDTRRNVATKLSQDLLGDI